MTILINHYGLNPADPEARRILRDQMEEFFFGEDLRLRRHDYSVNIAGGFQAAQLTSDYVVANGISLPTKRRAYTRGPDRRPIMEMLMVAIDFSEVRFE